MPPWRQKKALPKDWLSVLLITTNINTTSTTTTYILQRLQQLILLPPLLPLPQQRANRGRFIRKSHFEFNHS